MNALTEAAVHAAATALIKAFGSMDTDAYFGAFAPNASFIFHTEPDRVASTTDYRNLWAGWVADGWRVQGCTSTNQLIQLAGPTAVFTHDIETLISVNGTPERLTERETIIFAATADGAITAIHEHLSPAPSTEQAAS